MSLLAFSMSIWVAVPVISFAVIGFMVFCGLVWVVVQLVLAEINIR